jgi:type IV pilus assembly protein PilY1
LFALNVQTGLIKVGFPISNLSGTSGSPSNLGRIAPWADSPATNNTTQFVYAGDTNGDVWRFDMNPNSTGHSTSAGVQARSPREVRRTAADYYQAGS